MSVLVASRNGSSAQILVRVGSSAWLVRTTLDHTNAARRHLPTRNRSNQLSLFSVLVQLVDYAFQLFKLLPSLAKFTFRSQALVISKIFTGLCNQ